MCIRASDKLHVTKSSQQLAGLARAAGTHGKSLDPEKAGVHTHLDHDPPSQSARLLAFSAYASGVLTILLSNMAPHAD